MKSLIVAPHPDDETLGAGGTILHRKKNGHDTAWLIMTETSVDEGWSIDFVNQRQTEIKKVAATLGFNEVYQLHFPTTKLDEIPLPELISATTEVLNKFIPDEIFLPHFSDVHSDHRRTYETVISSTKWFRASSLKRLLAYETLSETGLDPYSNGLFNPNYFVNIEKELSGKIDAMNVYKSEMGKFPFPRSEEAIVALAQYRGSAVGFKASEAFQLIREVCP